MEKIKMMDLGKLIETLLLTTSSNDDEALAAIREANAMLAESGRDWRKFLEGCCKPRGGQEKLEYLEYTIRKMTPEQRANFLETYKATASKATARRCY